MFSIHPLVLYVCCCGIMTGLSPFPDVSSEHLWSVFFLLFSQQRGMSPKSPLACSLCSRSRSKWPSPWMWTFIFVCDLCVTELNHDSTFTTSTPLTNRRRHWRNSPSSESIKQCRTSFIVCCGNGGVEAWLLTTRQKKIFYWNIITFATSCLHTVCCIHHIWLCLALPKLMKNEITVMWAFSVGEKSHAVTQLASETCMEYGQS